MIRNDVQIKLVFKVNPNLQREIARLRARADAMSSCRPCAGVDPVSDPSRTIIVEPVEAPSPAPREEPAEPPAKPPVREPEKVPA